MTNFNNGKNFINNQGQNDQYSHSKLNALDIKSGYHLDTDYTVIASGDSGYAHLFGYINILYNKKTNLTIMLEHCNTQYFYLVDLKKGEYIKSHPTANHLHIQAMKGRWQGFSTIMGNMFYEISSNKNSDYKTYQLKGWNNDRLEDFFYFTGTQNTQFNATLIPFENEEVKVMNPQIFGHAKYTAKKNISVYSKPCFNNKFKTNKVIKKGQIINRALKSRKSEDGRRWYAIAFVENNIPTIYWIIGENKNTYVGNSKYQVSRIGGINDVGNSEY